MSLLARGLRSKPDGIMSRAAMARTLAFFGRHGVLPRVGLHRLGLLRAMPDRLAGSRISG